ncbi:ATP-binding protein [Pedobacter jeongneungensis]|uniref:sensor histidine kinase n=1 Tax=Pedobacter jeongneungensis TaxID=947309 RepID=UPI00046959A0|nr:ATP-binding protein [Pedobacter jeongneungensis]
MHDQKLQVNALTDLNEELENYFRNTIIPQLFVDASLTLRKFTPPAMKQFSLKDSDIGKPIADVKENFRFPSIMENIQQVIDTGEILEKEIQTIDFRWYQMNILPYIVRKDNKTNGVIITFVEITMRIRDLKEQERLIAEHELLLDTISHDIKTPLTSLGLTIEMLKALPDKGMERFPLLLEKVENSLRKMKDVIFDLTDSRNHQQKYKAFPELISFEHIVEDARLTLAPQILESGAVINTEIEVSEMMFVRRKLRSIVYNLVNNAIKYQAAGRAPVVIIKTALEKGYVTITVSDNGMGIAEENLNTIFTKFQRLNNDVEGTGVGLYLVREIVDYAGGKITVESEVGKGSSFKVYLKLEHITG